MTREEAIIYLKRADTTVGQAIKTKTAEALEMAIKALEQESILDKIRAEITNIHLTDTDGHNQYWYRDPQAIINDALQIIDKYRAESEEV